MEVFKTEDEGAVKVELVAISRGSIPNEEYQHAPNEMRYEERVKVGELYEFYNVLWVEWVGGVAYRKAHGRVDKGAWDRLDVEKIQLVLG